jgi:Ca-activated chloride channel homolog
VDGTAPTVTTGTSFEAVKAATRALTVVNRGIRLLAVIDISGSMNQKVRGAGGASRLDLVRAAASQGLGLFPDTAQVGLWMFATRLDGPADYRELVPIGPLGAAQDGITRRTVLARSLASLKPRGDTGLYDTVLAAVRTVRGGWRPDMVNSVVLLSDGRNEDRDGMTYAQLVRALTAEDDPRRPVPVITIAYGAGSDEKVLAAISRMTGGSALVAKDPRRVREVFLEAIGERLCRPHCG